MIFIGDLSQEDAIILKNMASVSNNICEFGTGGSTQILRKYSSGNIVSVETSLEWIEKTKRNLELLSIKEPVSFVSYYDFNPEGEYDLVFSDGADEFRLEFALATWNNLKIGGHLLFHDTRRSKDVSNVCEFVKLHSPEVQSVEINKDHSNITVIKKKTAEFYMNWSENKPKWLCGYEEVNEEELKTMLEKEL